MPEMGTRERKAQETRQVIADAALRLFEEHGYEQTSMELIAETAGVGTSTLYRYYPTKDSTLIDSPGFQVGAFARFLAERPPSEGLEEAMGRALDAFLDGLVANAEMLSRIRRQIDQSPVARARVWDLWSKEQELLENAVAARPDAATGTLPSAVATRICLMIAQLALDDQRTDSPVPPRLLAHEVINLVRRGIGVIPRLPLSH